MYPSHGSYLKPDDIPSRPDGEVVWVHATEPAHAEVALQLAEQLTNQRPDIHLLLTTNPGIAVPPRATAISIHAPIGAETAAGARGFLNHWQPDICIWTAGQLHPVLLAMANRRDIPLFLVDAEKSQIGSKILRWLPGGQRVVLRLFSTIMARNSQTAQALNRSLGNRGAKVTAIGPLEQDTRPLPYNQGDHEELSDILRGRPIWHAAHLQRDEVATVIAANSDVTRMSHRTVLVLSPEKEDWQEEFQTALDESGLRYITWSEGSLPDENTQAILADTPEELGLWYRIAPITFMGSSLAVDANGSDPNEPAAHGSAVLYGPNVKQHLETYARFAEAGAARIVRDARSLALAVQRLIPADQSAAMAHAAWDVSTQSAAMMDMLVNDVAEALDRRRAG